MCLKYNALQVLIFNNEEDITIHFDSVYPPFCLS